MWTVSGVKFHHFNPKPKDVKFFDLAHHPSMICRFTGAVPYHYSVTQHEILVMVHMYRQFRVTNARKLLHGLMHDVTEAYMNDLHSQFKRHLDLYLEAYMKCDYVVRAVMGLDTHDPPEVKRADLDVCCAEVFHLKGKGSVPPHPVRLEKKQPEQVRSDFITLYEYLKEAGNEEVDSGFDRLLDCLGGWVF